MSRTKVSWFAIACDATAEPLLVHSGGAFDDDTLVPLDSSIKPTTSLLIHTLIRDGLLNDDDTLGELLGWASPEGDVRVDQLLSFTSGFPGSSTCLTPPPMLRGGTLVVPPNRTTLAECAEQVRAGGLFASPGTEFHYGANHQLILAVVAETVTRMSWDALFEARVLTPLGFTADQLGYRNNRVAASATSTAMYYSTVFRAIASDAGLLDADATSLLIPRERADAFLADYIRTNDVTITDSPWMATSREVHFGLGIWILCGDYADPATCLYLGSGGNGTTAWMDPVGNYVAALVLYQGSFTGYRVGADVMEELVPAIRTALVAP
jgi:CubicO group peptidase (beta-lactamase class C family)